MSASQKKMEALSASLRASMPAEASEIKPPARTPSPTSTSPAKAPGSNQRKSTSSVRRSRGGNETAPSADMSQLALDYEEIRGRYEEVLKENESLRADAKRRLESYTRREKKYQDEVDSLRGELERNAQGKPQEDAHMQRLRNDHKHVLDGIGSLQKRTATVLQEQEKDLLRAFRARLYDVQIELEVERSKKDDGALEWIERTRTLGKELDWSREEALRLDRVNQFLAKENTRLKAQLKSQEDDRDFLVRQMLALKKENARLKPAAGKAGAPRSTAGAGADGRPATAGSSSSGPTSALRGGSSAPGTPVGPGCGGATAAAAGLDEAGGSLATAERLKEMRERAAESEARYREIVAKLKRLLEVERRNLRAVRAAHAKDLESRTELEALLRACVQDVKHEISLQRQAALGAATAGGGGGGAQAAQRNAARAGQEISVGELGVQERERVMELLLSQERVVSLLYERTFPPRPDDAVVPIMQQPPLEGQLGGEALADEEEAMLADSLL